jgi:type I restriction enzyme S subunit
MSARAVVTSAQEMYSAGSRVDASYHTSPGVQAMRFLKRWQQTGDARRVDTLDQVANMFNGPRFARTYITDPKRGVPFLSSSDMLQADLSGVKLLSRKHTSSQLLDSIRLSTGWTLISCSGTVGNTIYVRPDMDGMTGSQHIMRVVPKSDQIPSGYLYTFLSSSLGYALVTRGIYGGLIQHIEPAHIADLPIPRLDPATEQRIHEMIERAAGLWADATKKLEQSKKPFSYLLTDEIQRYFPHKTDSSIVKFSELDDKLGGHYHSGTYRRLESSIRTGAYEELGQLSTYLSAPPPFKHIYLKQPNEHPFITGGQLANRKFTDIRYLSPLGVKDINDYIIRENWLAIYKSGQLDSMLGTTFCVSKHLDGFCLSDHVIRAIVDESKIDPKYVYAFLSTWVGRLLMIRRAVGKSVPFIREKDAATVPIPIVSPDEQNAVVKQVKEALDLRNESLTLEDEAQALLLAALGWHDD